MLTYDVRALFQQILFCSRRLFYFFLMTKLEFHGFCVVLTSPRSIPLRKLANTLRLSQILLSNVRVAHLRYEGFHETYWSSSFFLGGRTSTMVRLFK